MAAITVPTLILLFPVIAVVAVLVWLKLGSPMLFRQQRPGLDGTPFTIFKFRTMTNARDLNGELLPDEKRTTAFGQVLRRTSLDELPELINVLEGDMRLVGPRPLLMEYFQALHPRAEAPTRGAPWYHRAGPSVRAQPSFLEGEVCTGCLVRGPLFSLVGPQNLAMTFRVVFGGEGVSAPSSVTAPEFLGTTGGDADCSRREPPKAMIRAALCRRRKR